MDKNIILAVAICVLVYVGWFKFAEPRLSPKAPASTAERSRAAGPQEGRGPGGAAGDAAPAAGASSTAGRTAPAARRSAPQLRSATPEPSLGKGGLERAVPFRVGKLELLIQPLGASIVSYRYPGPLGLVELIENPHPGFYATWPHLRFERAESDRNWPAFEARHPSGVRIRKEFDFRELGAIHSMRITLINDGRAAVTVPPWSVDLGPGIGTVASEKKENPSQWEAVALLPPEEGKTRERFLELEAEDRTQRHDERPVWIGIHNRYFMAAMFPPEQSFGYYANGAVTKRMEAPSWTGGTKIKEVETPWIGAAAKPIAVPGGGSVKIEVPFYFGPKGYMRLRELGHGLERSVSFGWFHRLGRLTMRVLNYFYGWTGNWGWAIILLTICIQFLLFPVTYKQMKSMAVMKKIQPEITRIQQKFKKDPKRLQVEMMQTYKKHGTNPLSGCLPLLIQMPIFIALFNMLRGAWELHGAPWIFWVVDLSARDPYYILPVVMGGIMFLQNKMNPQPSADPNQAKIMTYLPVIFTFMFLNFPAGLVLYWLTNSILSFAQQLIIKRRMGA